MSWIDTGIVVLKTVILLLGSVITFIAFKAYRQTGESAMRLLAIGFGAVTLGALLAGIAHQLFAVSLEAGVLINSGLVATGFAVIVYSLYLERE